MLRRLLDSPWPYFTLAGLLFVGLVLSQLEIRLPSRPQGTVEDLASLAERDDLNLIFVLIDTLRADRLSAYGYERNTSPTMDYLAATGIRFDRAVSQSSWTKTSMASLWTGTWPRVNGVLRWNHGLAPEYKLPAEILKEAGFVTTGLWRNGWVAPNFGFGQGFDTYLKPQPGTGPERFQRRNPSTSPLLGTDEDLTVGAGEFMRSYRDQRFFLYIHYMDVHQYAYDEPSALFGTSYSDVYDNAIHWTDRNIGSLVRSLEELGLADRTLLVIASDHGEGFNEHDLEGHGKTLFRETTEVPWILVPPFRLDPGIVVPQVVGNVDIWPTVLDLMGLPPLAGASGRSMVPLIEAAANHREIDHIRPVIGHMDRSWGNPKGDTDPIVAVTDDRHRAIRALNSEAEAWLYDHQVDPWEQKNLAAGGALPPEIAEIIDSYLASQETGIEPKETVLSDMELNQLRALGYVIQ